MADFSRRNFLKSAGMTLVAGMLPLGLIPDMAEAVEQGKMLFTPAVLYKADNQKQNAVCRINMETGDIRAVELTFDAHSLCPYPGNNNRAVVMKKWGQTIAVVDFEAQKVVRERLSDPDRNFSGHGFFSPAGDKIFITQADYATGYGRVAGFDAVTLEMVSDYPIVGSVHDCHPAQGNTCLVASTGMQLQKERQYWTKLADGGPRVADAALMHIDATDGKVLNKYTVKDAAVGHFACAPNGMIGAAAPLKESKDWSANLYVGDLEKGLKQVEMSDEIRKTINGDLFSLAIDHDEGVLAVTNPPTSSVLLVDIASAKIITHFTDKKRITGISYDKKDKLFISSGADGVKQVTLKGSLKETKIQKMDYLSHNVLA